MNTYNTLPYFDRFESKAAFKRANLTSEDLEKLHEMVVQRRLPPGDSWPEIKLILMHKLCPRHIREHYMQSKVWFIRLVAMLSGEAWKENIFAALQDEKSTVKAAAVSRLMYEGIWTENEAARFVSQNPQISGYFKVMMYNYSPARLEREEVRIRG